ncbi:arylsulfatase [Spongiibacter tropicus]|uniref:arylsulfatase n=1 Tax=Spongiibacter tropicus TaxID=454602 RepID=UPI0024E24CF6|nr:arylsulfatase [Spongiibacter tropicus]
MSASLVRYKRYLACMMSFLALLLPVGVAASTERPNFIVILADDMGWSDLSFMGSEIHTPTLDGLARRGVTMTRFYVSPTCSPTRSMLMTGVDSHIAGVGSMEGVQAPNQLESINYAGQLHNGVVTVAEALKSVGYATLMSGKWHLAKEAAQYPDKRGFDQSFFLAEGGASHFNDAKPLYRGGHASYFENGEAVVLPDDFYSSKNYTDKILEYINAVPEGAPFFAYLAYTAPHDPLQVPPEWADKYQGVYAAGPEATHRKRVAGLTDRGLIPADIDVWNAPQFPAFFRGAEPSWNERSLDERANDAKPMEIYASMIEYMDQQIARLLASLDAAGKLENTYVIFFSDNGPNGATPLSYPNMTRAWFHENFPDDAVKQGGEGGHLFQGREWAWASAAPFRLYKGVVSEGGVRSPLIVAGPGLERNKFSQYLANVKDISATLYALAGVDTQSNPVFSGKAQPEGKSLIHNWRDISTSSERRFAMELFGHQAVIDGSWKATRLMPPVGSGDWQLYNLESDPSETFNLAAEHPLRLEEMVNFYMDYKQRVGVIPPRPPVSISFGDLFVGECGLVCEFAVDIIDFFMSIWVSLSAD